MNALIISIVLLCLNLKYHLCQKYCLLNYKSRKSKKVREFKDTHREKSSSYKVSAFTKSVNMDIWAVGTSKQLFIRGS